MFISTNQLHLAKSGICISVEVQYCSGQRVGTYLVYLIEHVWFTTAC